MSFCNSGGVLGFVVGRTAEDEGSNEDVNATEVIPNDVCKLEASVI